MAATTPSKSSSPKQVQGTSTTNGVNAASGTLTNSSSIAAAKVVVADGVETDTTTPPAPANTSATSNATITEEKSTSAPFAAAVVEAVVDAATTASVMADAATGPAPTTETTTASSTSVDEPTYESTEQSETYQTALALLKMGDFAEALQTLEQGIEELTETLGPERAEFHESLAPFQYLYGSTLLYKVEEEEEDPNNANGGGGGMMMVNAPPPPQDGEYEDDGEAATAVAAAIANEEEDVEDLQIAYENLDSARALLEKMVQQRPTDDKLKVDLAQVHLREGDLNRLNGNNEAAVKDYEDALRHLENNSRVGKFDRKIADLYYNLGLTYTLQAAEAAAAAVPTEQPSLLMPSRETSFYRSRGMYHFWQCSKTLAGYMAFLCGVEDPQQLLDKAERDIANYKSTGEEEANEPVHQEHPAIVSRKLVKLREELKLLCLTQSMTDSEHQSLLLELSQLLEDIQETIDEAERSEQGVQQVTEMKAQISAAVAAAAMTEEHEGDNNNETSSSWGFGSTAAAAANTAAAQPMLVKKKKKRDAGEANLKDDTDRALDTKLPAAE